MEWFKVQRSIGDKWAAKIARAYRNGVYEADAKTDWSAVEAAIPRGAWAVYNAIQWNTWNPVSNLKKSYGEMYNRSQVYLQKFAVTKADFSTDLDPELFTMPNPAAEAWLMTYSSTEIRGISQQAMDNIRQILTIGQREKQTYKETAKRIREALGLNSKQSTALSNYRNKLRESGKTDAQIDNLADKYSNKMLRYRSETIALTESHTSTNRAWSDSVREYVKDGTLDPKLYALYWLTAMTDKRACDVCKSLNGVEGDLETQTFNGHNAPPSHPRCRCTTIVKRKK